MEKRGTKPEFTNAFCPDQDCKFYGVSGKWNNAGISTYEIKKTEITEHESGGSLNIDPVYN